MNEDKLIIVDGDCDTALIAEYESTRREAVRRGIAVGGAVIAASTIPALLRVSTAFAKADGDAAILEGAVGLEQTAVVAYDTAANSGLLDKPTSEGALLFRDQEQEHADGLIKALQDLGGTAPPPPKPEDVPGLTDVTSAADILAFAIELENSAIMAYIEAHKKLKDPALLATGAQIMANEGQHLVVLRQLAGATPAESAPSAFEAGTDPVPS